VAHRLPGGAKILGGSPKAAENRAMKAEKLRCLQLNTLNNYSVAAERVAVAAELDKFSRNMNSPAERFACITIGSTSPAIESLDSFDHIDCPGHCAVIDLDVKRLLGQCDGADPRPFVRPRKIEGDRCKLRSPSGVVYQNDN